MPRCYSCGKFSKTAQKEWDGRAERVYCEFCIAERDWKLQDTEELHVPFPHLSWWSRIRSLFGKR